MHAGVTTPYEADLDKQLRLFLGMKRTLGPREAFGGKKSKTWTFQPSIFYFAFSSVSSFFRLAVRQSLDNTKPFALSCSSKGKALEIRESDGKSSCRA